MSSITPRVLYRKLYRELSHQHVEATKLQLAHDKKKADALKLYRKKQNLNTSTDLDTPTQSITVSDYKTDTLRKVFDSSQPTAANLLFGVEIFEYLKSQRTYKALLERYNPGVNMDDEERIRLSARRVGLNLPEESD